MNTLLIFKCKSQCLNQTFILRLEYVGRFPTGPEVAALNFSLTVPVWLRSGQDDRLSLVGSLVEKLRIMSDWMLDNYAEN